MRPWCSLHDADPDRDDTNDDFLELPEEYWIGSGWMHLFDALFESLTVNGQRFLKQGLTVHFERIASAQGNLLIDYTGDHEWVRDQIDMVMRYAQCVDEATGDAKPVKR